MGIEERLIWLCENSKTEKEYFKLLYKMYKNLYDICLAKAMGEYEDYPIEKLQNINELIHEDIIGNNKYFSNDSDELHKYMSLIAYTMATEYKHDIFHHNSKDLRNFIQFLFDASMSIENCLNGDETIDKLKITIDNFYKRRMFNSCKEYVTGFFKGALPNDIVTKGNLDNINYLYDYGYYITENEIKTVNYFNSLQLEKIFEMAKSAVDGFKRGYVNARLNLDEKDFIIVYYPVGFEKMAREIYNLLSPELNVILKISSTSYCNRDLSYFHKNDYILWEDKEYFDLKEKTNQELFELYADKLMNYAGPIWVETFGEKDFNPDPKALCKVSDEHRKLDNMYSTRFSQMVSKYTNSQARSFSIISYPCPDIGENFSQIFDETVKINTLDNEKYKRIHQHIIDALDTGDYVHVVGNNGNKTNMYIQLIKGIDTKKETKFENCLADVNIPVGEVFTSPVLKGTAGVLFVSEVFLSGLKYKNLEFDIRDGMVVGYNCTNFDDDTENKIFIKENILNNNETLPIGEFAIGTNTLAYVMARKFNIKDKLDILIAEKTGPHFAFGDTCYSYSEDTRIYNPDGKEIIAKDNEISILRKTDMEKAYYGCHTDVTIPFDEIGEITVIGKNEITIIKDGKFILAGTEELNIEGM